MRAQIIALLDELMEAPRESDSGWAEVTTEDRDQLHELFRAIIEAKFEPDDDGDSPIEFILVNRNTHQRMHFCPMMYPRLNKGLEGAMRILNVASMNMSIASGQLDKAVGVMDFEMNREKTS